MKMAPKQMNVSVILPAAGLGTRMGKTSKKQFLHLDGAPILVHTLRRFAKVESVREIIIACRPEDMEDVRQMVASETQAKPVRLVPGGDSRQESVEHALSTVSAESELVAVHDAVRPFLSQEMIEHVIREAAESGAAILGIVPVDTVKQVHLNRIQTTISRDRLVLAQTPQVFRTELLQRAFAKAKADEFIGTDESSLVERLEEVEVRVVAGSDRNIKITKPTDLDLAKHFLAEESAA
jgi:2-C-methyl-D-erythritol 4-phosphate cytidylyltransferase